MNTFSICTDSDTYTCLGIPIHTMFLTHVHIETHEHNPAYMFHAPNL